MNKLLVTLALLAGCCSPGELDRKNYETLAPKIYRLLDGEKLSDDEEQDVRDRLVIWDLATQEKPSE